MTYLYEVMLITSAHCPKDVYKLFHHLMYPKKTTHLYSLLTFRGLKFWRNLIPDWFPQDRIPYFPNMVKTLFTDFLGGGALIERHTDNFPSEIPEWIHENTPYCCLYGDLNMTSVETFLLSTFWGQYATRLVAYSYKMIREKYENETSEPGSCDYQFHDFSMRGLWSDIYSEIWLDYHKSTDNLEAIRKYKERHPEANPPLVPATEHSVSSAYGEGEGEYEYFERIVFDLYPTGIISIVADTYDYFNFIDKIVPSFKERILKRDGKVVIRADSGNIVEITLESIKILDKHFGHTINSKGYKVLNEKIGFIYGDDISLKVADEILRRLKDMGYASSNVVLWVGAYAFNCMTIDTFGLAFKLSAIKKEGSDEWIGVQTDLGEASFKGIPTLYIDEDKCLRLKDD